MTSTRASSVKHIHSLERPMLREIGPLAVSLARGIRVQDVGPGFAFLLAYVALEWASFMHEHNGLPVTPWNPGLGIAFGLMVLKGPLFGLALFAGVVLAETLVLQTELDMADRARHRRWRYLRAMRPPPTWRAAICASTWASPSLRDLGILLAAGVAGAAVAAALLIVLLTATGQLGAGELGKAAVPLFVGDIIGIAVMTPVLLRLALHWPEIRSKPQLPVVLEIALYIDRHRHRAVADPRCARSIRLQVLLPPVPARGGRRRAARHRRRLRRPAHHPVRPGRAAALVRLRCRASSPNSRS